MMMARLSAVKFCFYVGLYFTVLGAYSGMAQAQSLQLSLRYQQATSTDSNRYHRLIRQETWAANQTAIIVCDMWDSHHCLNAVRRVQELAPRVDRLVSHLREQNATIIHAPSSCMPFYQTHPARLRALNTPAAGTFPAEIDTWCDQIPSEQQAAYPLDQADGGEDDDPLEHQHWVEQLKLQGRDPRAPWQRQIAAIRIDEQMDYISDSGSEIWSVLLARGIKQVMLVGVHTNMCVLGRPFGLRRLSQAGMPVVLVRDLTDTMYNPDSWPYVSHFTGTDLIVQHIERWVCPTISSNQILGGSEFRFSQDKRPQLTMIIAEDEYQTEISLPAFAAKHLGQHFRVTYAWGSDQHRDRVLSLEDLAHADALLISVRRRPLVESDMQLIRNWVGLGKPMIGIRTASHAFSLRGKQTLAGTQQWPEFDSQVWGGSYTNHYGNDLKATLSLVETATAHPVMQAIGNPFTLTSGGSLYKTAPLAASTYALMMGRIDDQPAEPVTWTNVRADGGRSFYTSLGHVDDFSQPQFEALLAAGVHWACDQPIPDLAAIQAQNSRYASGKGRQRR